MLTFLRKVRKSIIESGPTRKYILYALGEVLLVMIGILLALQVNNWNEVRKEGLKEQEFLNRLKNDLEYDLSTFQSVFKYLESVYLSGSQSLSYLDKEEKDQEDSAQTLAMFYNATQWTRLNPRETTFNEISQTGFPSNRELKNRITQYHSDFTIIDEIAKPSGFRLHIRSLIPAEIQKVLWDACHPTRGSVVAQVLVECRPNISEIQSKEILHAIVSDPRTKPLLNFWMGTVDAMINTLENSQNEALEMIRMLEEEVAK